jgi:hypothetical protein
MSPLLSGLTEGFLLRLSATRFSRMNATVLEMAHLDPKVSEEKPKSLRPGFVPAEII